MSGSGEEKTRRLPVRSLRVTNAEGDVESQHTVQCPRRHLSTAFERCCGCSHMRAIDVSEDGTRGTIECHVDGDDMPRGRVDVAEAAVRIRLGDVLPAETLCVRGDVTADEVEEMILKNGIRAVPVVDDARRLLGVISKTDLLRARREKRRRPKGRTVHDVMTPLVHGLPEDAPVAYAISLMAFERLHEVPVVDMHGHLIGMLTANDALRWVAGALGYVVPTAPAPDGAAANGETKA